ncbi:hypothetical protein BKA93DRAFT_750589 [Sparassis latifolia]
MSFYDVFGFIVGFLGLLGLIPVLLAIVQWQLPSRKLKELDEVLVETEMMWDATLKEGYALELRHFDWKFIAPHRFPKSSKRFLEDYRGSSTADERKKLQLEANFEQSQGSEIPLQSTETVRIKTSTKPGKFASPCVQVLYRLKYFSVNQFVSGGRSEETCDSSSTVCTHTSTPHSQNSGPSAVCWARDCAPFLVAPFTTSDKAIYHEAVKSCTLLPGATVLVIQGCDQAPALTDPSCDTYGSASNPETSSGDTNSVSKFLRPAAFDTAADCSLNIPALAVHEEPFEMRLPLSNAALLRQFRQVRQEVIVRGLGFYARAVSLNSARMMPWKKRSSDRFSGRSFTRWKSTPADVRMFSCDMGGSDVKECWEDYSDHEDTIYVDVPDVSDIV